MDSGLPFVPPQIAVLQWHSRQKLPPSAPCSNEVSYGELLPLPKAPALCPLAAHPLCRVNSVLPQPPPGVQACHLPLFT